MNKYIIFSLALLLIPCGNSTDTAKPTDKELILQESETEELNDTIFIKREITEDYYHVIYINTNSNSKYNHWLTDFEFDQYDSQTYQMNYQLIKKNNPEIFEKVNSTKVPENWIPVYLYDDHYYLYAPSDWGNAGKRIINDSAFVYWYMDGPLPVPLKRVEKVGKDKYVLEMIEPFNGKNQKLTIYQLDSVSRLSIFEFYDESESYYYQLYLPIENAKQFDIIVNYCDNQKQPEFDFDEIDYEQIIRVFSEKLK